MTPHDYDTTLRLNFLPMFSYFGGGRGYKKETFSEVSTNGQKPLLTAAKQRIMEPQEIREGYLVKKVRARTVLMILMTASLFPFVKVSRALVTQGLKEESTIAIYWVRILQQCQDQNTHYWHPSIPWYVVSVAHQSQKAQNSKCSTPPELYFISVEEALLVVCD